jgi:large subunit ribosomal protein L32
MPVPKRKMSRARRDKKHANKHIIPKAFTFCSHCSEPQMPHQICSHCGFYKGVKVMETKKDRLVKRGKQRQALAQRQAERAQQAQSAPTESNQ